jgi:hypothetical protein
MVKNLYIFILLAIFSFQASLFAQNLPVQNQGTGVFLLTINPGVETYSHYGHSALRVRNAENGTDVVYNWGVFDFATKNFAWKFAKGNLDYMLAADDARTFLSQYVYEQRSVYQQKVNLTPEETGQLLLLIAENLRPENVRYRYDFFYDDCSTRIRDLFEKILGKKLMYPEPPPRKALPSFREKVAAYQLDYPWLKTGIDLLFGLSTNKKASLRDQMFLPFDLQEVLSGSSVNRSGKITPLLQKPETLIEFPLPNHKTSIFTSPLIVLSLLLIGIIVFSATFRREKLNRVFDILFFFIFSVLSVLMIFFNFFSYHEQLKWNLNIVWLNPFVILCLVSLIFRLERYTWFRITFFLALIALVPMFFMPAYFNNAFIPLDLILILRSSMRAEFSINPFSLEKAEIQ